jgi:hypothetical protein
MTGGAPDPWKIWAPAFVIACTDGDDAAPALASLVATLAGDEVEAVGVAAEAAAAGALPSLHPIANELARDARAHARALGGSWFTACAVESAKRSRRRSMLS